MQSNNSSNKINLIFTSFWDTNEILNSKKICAETQDSNSLEIDFSNLQNIKIYAISLYAPPQEKIPNIFKPPLKLHYANIFSPTKEALFKYKKDKDFLDFSEKYINKFKESLGDAKTFLRSLVHKNIFLNCWENTSESVHCHRRLMFDILASSPSILKKFNLVYRHGHSAPKPNTLIASDKIERINLW